MPNAVRKRWQTCSLCRQQKRIEDFYRAERYVTRRKGRCKECLKERERGKHRVKRRERNRRRQNEFYAEAQLKCKALELRGKGFGRPYIQETLGISKHRAAQWLPSLFQSDRERMIALYSEEGLSLEDIGALLGVRWQTVQYHLQKAGVELRKKGRMAKPDLAHSSLKELVSSSPRTSGAAPKRRGDSRQDNRLTAKQQKALNVLAAARQPLKTIRISTVARIVYNDDSLDWSYLGTYYALRKLERKGAARCVAVPHDRPGRDDFVKAWVSTSSALAFDEARDPTEQIEIRRLIEEQEEEERRGISLEHGHFTDRSLDAPITEDGFTILDTLGSEDENLAELGAAA